MAPSEYVEVVVLPTVGDYLRTPSHRRLAYLSAITTFHVVDYLLRQVPSAERQDRRDKLKARCPDAFAVVEGMCHGTKHSGRNQGDLRFTPGDETLSRPFGFGPDCAGFGEGTFGPQRILVEHNGRQHVVDEAVVQFLRACQDAFPEHLAGTDLSDLHV